MPGFGADPNIKEPSKARTRKREKKEIELQLGPMLNLFLVIIPMLLMCARFSKSAILNLYLPSGSTSPGTKQAQEFQQKMLVIEITQSGDVWMGPKGSGQKVANITDNFSVITSETDAFENYKKIKTKIEVYKKQGLETCVIKAGNAVLYRYIVSMMDASREAGFQSISLGLI